MMIDHKKLFNRLRKRGYEIDGLSPYQYRVGSVLDLYPVRGRWHNLSNNQRGSWLDISGDDNKVAAFIDKQMAIADAILDQYIQKTYQGNECVFCHEDTLKKHRYMCDACAEKGLMIFYPGKKEKPNGQAAAVPLSNQRCS